MNKERKPHIYNEYKYVIDEIKNLLKDNEKLVIAIDGRCGGGKSSLGAMLAEEFDCSLFHMDDFFLPPRMKTKERLAQLGGNVHYERFEEEILKSLKNDEPAVYRKYLCNKGELSEPIKVEPKNLTIVEGSYSLHPTLRDYYDYKIFITIDSKVQHDRILKRNGEEKLQDFINKWIPLEEHYFTELDIENKCDIILDTTNIKR
ncbi:uridine kinase family protein [Clostridium beijerinckii]|uniref:Uridine kinase n=1 Tax=Clostridium beijerinckii TaxID=1520 RepID=A0AAW3WE54_CLOBE|nr:uridine kinase [Clostridium beijerinckii]MBC2459643.1 uridine kinase [Clostridium beijerinckii]MBC2477132.1 uridine kinase [Clostridium beijerinckii]NOV60436.1 uridine kinase [Clostridium beijerinckii]NOV70788.1 uridine kinase [Clostridium beijerinckii]NOW33705.1 uridine kinase [Clostridium beijerinckii]